MASKAWNTAVARKKERKAITEAVLGEEPAEDVPAWHLHDWTTQEVEFVAEYMRTGDECRAYRHAWKLRRSDSEAAWMTAGIRGRRLLDRPYMASYVDELQAKLRERLKLDGQSILTELAKLGYANMSDFVVLQEDGTPQFDLSGLSRDQSAAIQELTIDTYVEGRGEDARTVRSVKVKLAPKIGPLELLGKNLKLFTDVVETVGDADLADEIRQARQRKRERAERGDDGEIRPGDEGGADASE